MSDDLSVDEQAEQIAPDAPHKVVIDCQTGKAEYVLLTEEEILSFERARQDAERRELEMQEKAAENQALRDSAIEKVSVAMGLTKEELDALIYNGDFNKIITNMATRPESASNTDSEV